MGESKSMHACKLSFFERPFQLSRFECSKRAASIKEWKARRAEYINTGEVEEKYLPRDHYIKR